LTVTRSTPALLAATAFREGCEELAQQASGFASDIAELEGVTLDAISLEVTCSLLPWLHLENLIRVSPDPSSALHPPASYTRGF